MIFAQPLPPLTRRQRNVAIALGIIVALTRLLAISRSMWDWDEALFTMGVRDYDVPQHHPHPPGYPLFIAAAKLVNIVVPNEFRALQSVVILAALALFPALFFLGRELRFPFAVAAGGAALCAFFPNVWYYGGTALSDIPSLVLVTLASALLLRGCRDARAYVAGAVVLGLAASVRPQNLLVGVVPALIGAWGTFRAQGAGGRAQVVSLPTTAPSASQPPAPRALRPAPFVLAMLLGAAVIAICYAAAALASSSWREYLDACTTQSRYIRDVDSFHNPGRPPLLALGREIVLDPMRAGRFDFFLAALAAIGLIVARRRAVVVLAMFIPIQLFTWLMLDVSNFPRYSVAFLPLYAFLIAYATTCLRAVPCAAIAAYLVWWTLPALSEVRRTDSPVAAAMRSVQSSPRVYVQGSVAPFGEVFLAGHDIVPVERESELPMSAAPYVREGSTVAQGARVFRRNRHGRLSTFVRKHFFEVAVMPAASAGVFRDGWWGQETDGELAWNWMPGRASMRLPPAGPRARLTLRFHVPTSAPTLMVMMNGTYRTVRCTSPDMTVWWDFDANDHAPNELTLKIDPVFNPLREHAGGDARDLGLQLFAYDWRSE
jgi:hypothetical protein